METWDDVKQTVELNGDVYTFRMEELRMIHGVERLGVHVRNKISNSLAEVALGHVPRKLPRYQEELVRVYKRGTPIEELIENVLTPGASNDEKLLEQVSGSGTDYAAIIEEIRDLVVE